MLPQRPFSADVEKIAALWSKNAVCTDPAAFDIVPHEEWNRLGLPEMPNESTAVWVMDRAGRFCVGKTAGPTDYQPYGCQRERIAADFAYRFKLPVPPVQLWEKDGRLMSLSLRPFAGARHTPSRAMMLADPFLPAMARFDFWTLNLDRHAKNILYNSDNTRQLGYIDHKETLDIASFMPLGGFKYHWALYEVRNFAFQEIPHAPTAQRLRTDLENLADSEIREVILSVPVPERTAWQMIDILRRQRDTICAEPKP